MTDRTFSIGLAIDDEDGTVTVYSKTEPIFCFVRNNEAEANAVALDTIRSYLENFEGADNIQITAPAVEQTPSIPVKQLRVSKVLSPVFTKDGDGQLAYG